MTDSLQRSVRAEPQEGKLNTALHMDHSRCRIVWLKQNTEQFLLWPGSKQRSYGEIKLFNATALGVKMYKFFQQQTLRMCNTNKSILLCNIYIIYIRELNFFIIISLMTSVRDASLLLNILYLILLSDTEYKCFAPCWIWLPLQSDFSPSKCDCPPALQFPVHLTFWAWFMT